MFSPENTIASGSGDGTIRLWNVNTGEHENTLTTNDKQSVYSVAFNPDRRILASGHEDGTIRLWNADYAHNNTRRTH